MDDVATDLHFKLAKLANFKNNAAFKRSGSNKSLYV